MRVRLVELLERAAETLGIAPHLIQCEQQVEAIERCILETFGVHRSGVLLQLHREVQAAR